MMRGERQYQEFPSTVFCFPVPKNFVGESFTVLLIRVSENVIGKSGDGNHDFPSKMFCLTVSNHFIEEPFSVVFQ